MSIAITGASGFVGGHLVRAAAAAGVEVRAVAHQGLDAGGWRRELKSADVVVHLANRAHSRAGRALVQQDVQAMRLLIDAAHDGGASRLVYLSSIKAAVPGASRPGSAAGVGSEASSYGAAKRDMESLLRHQDLPWVVLRPCLVHGAGMKGNLARLARAIRHGRPLPVGGCRNERSMLSVADLCEGVLQAALRPGVTGHIITVAHPTPLSTEQVVRALAQGVGRPPRVVPALPEGVRRWGRRLPGGAGLVDSLWGSLVVDGSGAASLLGASYDVGPADSLSAAARQVA